MSYFRDKPPAIYWRHFALFLVLALVVHIGANWIFGLYGRIWRYAGIQEARQILVSTLSAFVVLVALRPIWHGMWLERVPLNVLFIGCALVTMGTGALRFHSRLFAWQRGSHRVGLRVAVIGSRDAGATAIREMLNTPVAGLVPVAVFDDDGRGTGSRSSASPSWAPSRTSPRPPCATRSSRSSWPSRMPRPRSSNAPSRRRRRPA